MCKRNKNKGREIGKMKKQIVRRIKLESRGTRRLIAKTFNKLQGVEDSIELLAREMARRT